MHDHTTPCATALGLVDRVSRVEGELHRDHSWIEDIHADHELTKEKVNKLAIRIAVIAAITSFIGAAIGGSLSERVAATGQRIADSIMCSMDAYGAQ